MQYTQEQQNIIKHDINSHAIVSAVAGSGKTQTLIARIEHLLSQDVSPSKILVLMYNKSAQVDFTERLQKLLGANARQINVRTMHSLGNSFLQAFAKAGFIKFVCIWLFLMQYYITSPCFFLPVYRKISSCLKLLSDIQLLH